MTKNRAFALLFFSFMLIIGSVLAAEIKDQPLTSGSGLSGQVNIDANTLYPNGHSCSSDTECYSGHCAADYDGTGKWCATTNYCAHNGTVTYSNGSKTCYGNYKKTCTSGSWVSELCSASCSNGECSGGTVCGNGQCESGETCSSCSTDCGVCSTSGGVSGGAGGGGGGGGGNSSEGTDTTDQNASSTEGVTGDQKASSTEEENTKLLSHRSPCVSQILTQT